MTPNSSGRLLTAGADSWSPAGIWWRAGLALVDTLVPLDAGVREAGTWLGEWYDFTCLFGTIFPILGRWLKAKWKNPFNNSRALFCSEAVTKVPQVSKYPRSEFLVPENTTPQDLLVFLTEK